MGAFNVKLASALAGALLSALFSAGAAELKVFCSGGFRATYSEALPEFERTTGIKVVTTWAPSQGNYSTTIGRRLARGETADLVIMAKDPLVDLVSEGRIEAGSVTDLAASPLALAVRAGAPKPDIATVEALKKTLLSAKSVATAGAYVETRLFPRLGVAGELEGKRKSGGVATVAIGSADMVIQPLSELLTEPRVDVVGLIPDEVQYLFVFSAGIVTGSSQPAAARQLIEYLASDKVSASARKAGMQRPASR